ncbi:MAG: hypothetical protein ABF296_09430 [Oceanococcaceae bacterium]
MSNTSPATFTVAEVLSLFRGAAELRKLQDAKEITPAVLATVDPDALVGLLRFFAGPETDQLPMHVVLERVRNKLAEALNDLARYIDQQVNPEATKIAELLGSVAE